MIGRKPPWVLVITKLQSCITRLPRKEQARRLFSHFKDLTTHGKGRRLLISFHGAMADDIIGWATCWKTAGRRGLLSLDPRPCLDLGSTDSLMVGSSNAWYDQKVSREHSSTRLCAAGRSDSVQLSDLERFPGEDPSEYCSLSAAKSTFGGRSGLRIPE